MGGQDVHQKIGRRIQGVSNPCTTEKQEGYFKILMSDLSFTGGMIMGSLFNYQGSALVLILT